MGAQPLRADAPERGVSVDDLAVRVTSLEDSVNELLGGLQSLEAGVAEDRESVRDLIAQLADQR